MAGERKLPGETVYSEMTEGAPHRHWPASAGSTTQPIIQGQVTCSLKDTRLVDGETASQNPGSFDDKFHGAEPTVMPGRL